MIAAAVLSENLGSKLLDPITDSLLCGTPAAEGGEEFQLFPNETLNFAAASSTCESSPSVHRYSMNYPAPRGGVYT